MPRMLRQLPHALLVLAILVPAGSAFGLAAIENASNLVPDPSPAAASPAPTSGLELPTGFSADDADARSLVRSLAAATPFNDHNGNRVYDDLEAQYNALGPTQTLSVIVSFVEGSDAATRAPELGTAHAFEVRRTFDIIPAFVAQLSLAQALAIANEPDVRQIEWNAPGYPHLDTSTYYTGARAAWEGLGIEGNLNGNASHTKEDIVVAIIDTGIAPHQDLKDRISHFMDVSEGGATSPVDECGHGTHVASIALGSGAASDGRYTGVAPGASVIGIKVVRSGECFTYDEYLIAAWEWVVKNKDEYNIRVTSMSMGGGWADDGTTAGARAIDAAWDAGVVTVVSAGNGGPDSGTISQEASARGALTVGNMIDPSPGELPSDRLNAIGFLVPERGWSLHRSSSRGPTTDERVKPDVSGPGSYITAADAHNLTGYTTKAGTSMSTPFVAGIVALMIHANPDLRPDDVRDILRETSHDWGSPGPDSEYGWGRADALAAVQASLARANATVPYVEEPINPVHQRVYGTFNRTLPPSPLGQNHRLQFAEGSFVVANATGRAIAGTLITEDDEVSDFAILAPGQQYQRRSLPRPVPPIPVAHQQAEDGLEEMRRILDEQGQCLGRIPGCSYSRQAQFTFMATQDGEYRFYAEGTPGAAFVLDFSYGAAPRAHEPAPLLEAADRSLPVPAPAPVVAVLVGALLMTWRGRFQQD